MSLLEATPEDVERFMRYVEKLPCGCWFWAGARSRGRGNKKWYGSFWLPARPPARPRAGTVRAHRFSVEVIGGEAGPRPCPPEHHRDHLCLFTLCVNPDHVDVVHRVVNQQRKMERRRLHV